MDDEVKQLLREILRIQTEHLNAFRAFTEKTSNFQGIALARQKTQMRNALIAAAVVCVAGLLLLLLVVTSK